MPIDQPQEEEPPDAVEMRSSGPWRETEINTASGDEAISSYLTRAQQVLPYNLFHHCTEQGAEIKLSYHHEAQVQVWLPTAPQ